jgi:hypothetical protein
MATRTQSATPESRTARPESHVDDPEEGTIRGKGRRVGGARRDEAEEEGGICRSR